MTCHILLGNGRGPSVETLSFFAGKPSPSRDALAWRHTLAGGGAEREHLALPLNGGILERAGWGFSSQRSGENIEGVGLPKS